MSTSVVSVAVPTTGEGTVVDTSSLVGEKTVVLSGTFSGIYELLGSHNDSIFVPVLQFDSGGVEGIRLTVPGSFKSMRLRSRQAVPSSDVTCTVSGTSVTGQNSFGTLASLAAGFSGLTSAVDLSTLFPPTGPEVGLCFACEGSFTGTIVVMGSLNGSNYCPIGSFTRSRVPDGAPASVEFTVLTTSEKLRYVKLNVQGVLTGAVTVTVGGGVPPNASSVNSLIEAGVPEVTDLGDTDDTVHPAVTNTTTYRIPAETQTTNRTTILGTNGPPETGQIVDVVRYDQTAYARAIVDGGPLGNTLYTFAASPTVPRVASFQYNGADWQFVGVRPLAGA